MSQHLVILRSLLNCKENQLRIEYTKANEQSDSVGTSSATTNLFNWSTSLADDMGEKIVRRIEEPQLKSVMNE